ncbi:hypothetical protein [Candidatus Nitrosocosmicus sp. SS]|uniref:hypothetical protein n=1 Tax=Candidatus Nitrosocosmicus agrestis TaxID=2563600 RepID=UPI00122E4410|nr:hypothetical protein [Candidatus Nitrosocosmicus sp. SS]KAA2279368.1 hypothetical protein F1Z66_13710 [Candidatus Nitrosocosmicus sp. SS]KAF0867861.1 hypothetical protein E5N71_13250 [Candidatus Nitrosocosmicus sp. SS]
MVVEVNLSQNSELKIKIDKAKHKKLITIIEDLYEGAALESPEIEEFLKFTLFIVFDEYDKNKESIGKFYKANLQNYLKSKNMESQFP